MVCIELTQWTGPCDVVKYCMQLRLPLGPTIESVTISVNCVFAQDQQRTLRFDTIPFFCMPGNTGAAYLVF